MIKAYKEDHDAISRMLERYPLQGILEMLAYHCQQYAERVRTQWKDENLAQAWERDASCVDMLRAFLSRLGG